MVTAKQQSRQPSTVPSIGKVSKHKFLSLSLTSLILHVTWISDSYTSETYCNLVHPNHPYSQISYRSASPQGCTVHLRIGTQQEYTILLPFQAQKARSRRNNTNTRQNINYARTLHYKLIVSFHMTTIRKIVFTSREKGIDQKAAKPST